MSDKPNILFIMADQWRADYLGCAGHQSLKTPNLDWLAAQGTRFNKAFCQAAVCGPSRMCFYTGRYAINHGATYNSVPLAVGECTLGDYLRPLGYRVALVGKTHMRADIDGMQRLGVDPASSRGVLAAQCGFEPYERDDGLHPDPILNPELAYNCYLNGKGYTGANPWHDWANSSLDEHGELASGWFLRNADLPARVEEADSETPYMTDRAMGFIEEAGEQPWCLHLSYIKPHWPYMAPRPYHDLYGNGDIQPVNNADRQERDPHPVVSAFREHQESVNFSDRNVRDKVIPTYMGLITQLDDHLGRLFDFLRERGQLDNTVIVFTSDHGDFLGDHGLGEKELLYEEALRIPLIIKAPGGVAGRVSDELVESLDLIPTFIQFAGGDPKAFDHVLEGASLAPLMMGQSPASWRDSVFAELDYAWRAARLSLKRPTHAAKARMVRTERWKYIQYDGFRAQLFDLFEDPQEINDLGEDAGHRGVREEMEARLSRWAFDRRTRHTVPNAAVSAATEAWREKGIVIGEW